MKILSLTLYIVGICFCIAGITGHFPAFAGAALSFFAATMIIVRQAKSNCTQVQIYDARSLRKHFRNDKVI